MTLVAGALCLCGSVSLPYWEMSLDAKQYQRPLSVVAYPDRITGDISEIDLLNHYIGMRSLKEAASFERSASVYLMIAMVLMVEVAAFVHSKWAVLLAIPVIGFPVGFLVDLYFWMRHFGLNLDPHAPLSNSVKPFVPTVLGEGGIGQFKTYAELGTGYWLAVASGAFIIVGFFFHRRAYRPLAMASTQNLKAAA